MANRIWDVVLFVLVCLLLSGISFPSFAATDGRARLYLGTYHLPVGSVEPKQRDGSDLEWFTPGASWDFGPRPDHWGLRLGAVRNSYQRATGFAVAYAALPFMPQVRFGAGAAVGGYKLTGDGLKVIGADGHVVPVLAAEVILHDHFTVTFFGQALTAAVRF